MPRVRVHGFSVSLDGYAAGPDQSRDHPLGVGGMRLHDWHLEGGGPRDAEFSAERERGAGATIMGRNMFGPIRGPWNGDPWRGWWGEDPPYHHPVFILTHHPHDPIPMAGGTTFHFVTEGIEAALERAVAAADGRDVVIGGGASTVRQFLRAGLIDEMHIVVAPVLLGRGERLFGDLPGIDEAYECTALESTSVAHLRIARR